jgi:hypothetical protein
MKYTITFTPESIANRFNTTEDFVSDHWEYFVEYLENFEDNWMGDVLWEDAEGHILDMMNQRKGTEYISFPEQD